MISTKSPIKSTICEQYYDNRLLWESKQMRYFLSGNHHWLRAAQRQTAVTAYLKSEQLLLFVFPWQLYCHYVIFCSRYYHVLCPHENNVFTDGWCWIGLVIREASAGVKHRSYVGRHCSSLAQYWPGFLLLFSGLGRAVYVDRTCWLAVCMSWQET